MTVEGVQTKVEAEEPVVILGVELGQECTNGEKSLDPSVTHPTSMITFNCELCNVQCSSEEVFETHLKGQKHQKKVKRKQELEQSGMAERIINSDTYCKVCSVELTSKAHMPLHLAGKRHRQNLMKSLSVGNSDSEVAKTVEEFEKKQKEEEQRLIDRAGIKDFEEYAIPSEKKQQALAEGAKNEFYCKLCKKFFTGRTQLAMHIMSVRHKEKENPSSIRPKRLATRGRRFFDVMESTRPRNFYQNSVSDLSMDFSAPPKLARMEDRRDRRSEFLVDPYYRDDYSARMPPPKLLYSRPGWRRSFRQYDNRDFHSSNFLTSMDPWSKPDFASYDQIMDDYVGSAPPPSWYSSDMPQNYYEDFNPDDFEGNFYRGPI